MNRKCRKESEDRKFERLLTNNKLIEKNKMRLFIYNIKHAFNSLRKNASYSLLTIIGLSIGLSVFLSISLFVYNENTVDQNITNYQRIYRLYDVKENNCGIGYELADVISQNYPEVEANCALSRFEWPMLLRTNNNSFKFNTGISATNTFFDVFDIKFVSKIGNKPFPDKESIILTQATAKKLFGDEDPLGQVININNYFKAKVSAIIEGFPKNSSIEAGYLINCEDKEMRMSTTCNNGDCYNPMSHYLLLKDKSSETQFITLFNKTIPQFQSRVDSFAIQKLTDIYLSDYKEGSGSKMGNKSFINIVSVIGLIILILAIINYLNFSLSLQHSKIKEISIKKINGAGSFQLFFYYLAESLIIIVLSTGFSISFIYAFKDSISSVLGGDLNIQVFQEPVFIIMFIMFLILILLINSIIPAYSLLKLNVVNGLNKGMKRNDKSGVKTIFTTTQFVASIVLLISVFFIHKQLSFIESKDLGFSQQNLLRIEVPYKFENYTALEQGIRDLSFVENTSFSFGCPGEVNMTMGSGIDDIDMNIQCILVDSNFLKTFEISLINGRDFLGGDFHESCLFNEAAMKKIGWDNLENRKYNNGKKGGYGVIGVVNDFNVSSLHNTQEPVCLIYDDGNSPSILSVRITPGQINQQIKQIKKVWESILEDPFEFQFYDAFFNTQYQKERQLSNSITLMAIIAIILTLIGILGQVIQTCAYRTKEIGIRKVNGAKVTEIVNMLNLDFVKWVLIAFLIAVPIAYYSINKWLDNFAYKTPVSWWVFIAAGSLVLFITLTTVSWQTLKVAKRNPVDALRYE